MSMKKTIWIACLIAALGLQLFAQNPAPTNNSEAHDDAMAAKNPEAHDDAAPAHAYRLNFSVNELEEGRKVNSRQYSMDLNSGDADEVKVGTRVPLELKQGEVQYLDVGTRLWCRLKEAGNGLVLSVRTDISSFPTADQSHALNNPPLLRQFVINGSTVLLPNKGVVVGSVDDPTSKRTLQLEVTVLPLK